MLTAHYFVKVGSCASYVTAANAVGSKIYVFNNHGTWLKHLILPDFT